MDFISHIAPGPCQIYCYLWHTLIRDLERDFAESFRILAASFLFLYPCFEKQRGDQGLHVIAHMNLKSYRQWIHTYKHTNVPDVFCCQHCVAISCHNRVRRQLTAVAFATVTASSTLWASIIVSLLLHLVVFQTENLIKQLFKIDLLYNYWLCKYTRHITNFPLICFKLVLNFVFIKGSTYLCQMISHLNASCKLS